MPRIIESPIEQIRNLPNIYRSRENTPFPVEQVVHIGPVIVCVLKGTKRQPFRWWTNRPDGLLGNPRKRHTPITFSHQRRASYTTHLLQALVEVGYITQDQADAHKEAMRKDGDERRRTARIDDALRTLKDNNYTVTPPA